MLGEQTKMRFSFRRVRVVLMNFVTCDQSLRASQYVPFLH